MGVLDMLDMLDIKELLRITLIIVFITILIKCCNSEDPIVYLIDSAAYYKEYVDSAFNKL